MDWGMFSYIYIHVCIHVYVQTNINHIIHNIHDIVSIALVDPPENKIWQSTLVYTKFFHVACNDA